VEYAELWQGYLDARISLGRAQAAAERDLELAEEGASRLEELIPFRHKDRTRIHAVPTPPPLPSLQVEEYNEFLARYLAYRRKSRLGRLFAMNPYRFLVAEGRRLLAEGDEIVADHRRRVEAAVAARAWKLESFEPHFRDWHDAAGMVPGGPASQRSAPGPDPWSDLGWVEFDPERSWATLPWQGGATTCLAIAPGSVGLAAGAAFAQRWVLGLLAAAEGRRIRLTWIDPIGRGASAGPLLRLLDIDRELLDGQVWSEPDQIAERLRLLTDRVSYVQQRRLKDRFKTLADYNAAAGDLAEPYHVVCAIGYPHGFTEEAADRLRSLVSHSERGGVGVVAVWDPAGGPDVMEVGFDPESPYWLRELHTSWSQRDDLFTHEGVLAVTGHAGRCWVQTAGIAMPLNAGVDSPEAAAAVVEGYGARSRDTPDSSFASGEEVARETLESGAARKPVSVEIGIGAGGNTTQLTLDESSMPNVLVGGPPGSGKSSFFHTFVTQAIRRYDWNALELYLLDFKQGGEFRPYATLALPHARVVAIGAEREFAVSVLRGLRAELDRRAALFRAAGVQSLEAYGGEEAFPRTVLIGDEFDLLFLGEDRLADEVASILGELCRQGPPVGIHTVLSTGRLHDMGRLLRGAVELFSVRVALKMSEAESRSFLGADNDAAGRLRRPGEAVLSTDSGDAATNLAFQVSRTTDDVLDALVEKARRRADLDGFVRRPVVFDSSVELPIEAPGALQAFAKALNRRGGGVPVALGEPVSLEGDGGVLLSRQAGRNVLVVSRDERTSRSLLAAALVSLEAAPEEIDLRLVDCLAADEEGAAFIDEAADLLRTSFYRRKSLGGLVQGIEAEVRRRLAAEDYVKATRIVVLVNAIHRARELGDEPVRDDTHVRARLLRILRDGPDVGVHCLVTADNAESLARRLGRDGLAEFAVRVVDRMSVEDSRELLDSDSAATLKPRFAFLHDADDGRLEKIRPFAIESVTQFEEARRLVSAKGGVDAGQPQWG
jgi:hypothetical protein